MIQYTSRLIIAEFDRLGIPHRVIEGNSGGSLVVVNCRADNLPSLAIQFISLDDNTSVGVRIHDLVTDVPDRKQSEVCRLLNELNSAYRFAKFVLTDGSVNVEYDLPLNTNADCLGACCQEMLRQLVTPADAAYPYIMQALQS